MSQDKALDALATGEIYLEQGDHEAAIVRFEAAAEHFIAAKRHMQAVSTYRRIFGLDMLRPGPAAKLADVLGTLGKEGCRAVWQEHIDKVTEIKVKWPFRTATVRLATVDFDDEGQGYISYLEGSDPLARLGRVSRTLIRCRCEPAFTYLTDIMLASIVAEAVKEWGQSDPNLKVELELMRSKRTFLIGAQGSMTLAGDKGEHDKAETPQGDRLLAMLYEADLLATFGMSESARSKYEAVLEFDPKNERAKSAILRIDDALAAELAKQDDEPTDVGPPPAELKNEIDKAPKGKKHKKSKKSKKKTPRESGN